MNVLFLDTESNNSVVRQHLESTSVAWNYQFVTEEQQAIEILKNQPIDVLVLDVVPRNIARLGFLLHVSDYFPRVIRIVYTEAVDKDEALKAATSTNRYLAKSSDPQPLISCISRTIALYESIGSESLCWLISGITTLPSIPETYNQLVSELNSESSSAESIAEIVSRDPAITSKILQIVNSALFGMRHRINDLQQAVALLGTSTIKSLTLSIGAFQQFKGDGQQEHAFVGLMQHSLEVAIFSQSIAMLETGDKDIAAEAFTAGVLHDVGKLILISEEYEKFQTTNATAREEQIELIEAERQIWGANHAEIGALLLSTWGLPTSIVEVVALHHQLDRSPDASFSTLAAVAAADAISRSSNFDQNQESLTEYLEAIGCGGKLESWTESCLQLVGN